MADHIEHFDKGNIDARTVTLLPELVSDVAAVGFELDARVTALGGKDEAALARLLDQLLRLRLEVPEAKFVASVEDARTVAGANDGTASRWDGTELMVENISTARSKLAWAVDGFDEDVAESGKSDAKAPILSAAAAEVGPAIEYVERALVRGNVGTDLNDKRLWIALAEYRSAAQRFVYCAMYDPQLRDAADDVAAASDPLLVRVGLEPLVVASGAPKDDTEKGDLARKRLTYRTHWQAVYKAQTQALQDLIDIGDGKQEAQQRSILDAGLFTLLASARFTGVLGLVAGFVGSVVEDHIEGASRPTRNAVKTATQDVIKVIAKDIFASRAPSGAHAQARAAFFGAMKLALIELESRHLTEFENVDMVEAERSPDARNMLRDEANAVKAASSQYFQDHEWYKSQAVQDWATHQAATAYGQERATGGVNLDRVGGFEPDGAEAVGRDRPTGVLELSIDLGDAGEVPRIARATAGGIGPKDAASIRGTVGDLRMPVQLRGYGQYVEGTVMGLQVVKSPSLLVSRNVEGTVWLSQVDDDGRAWLTRLGDGDPLAGAQRLFDVMAGERLPVVEAT